MSRMFARERGTMRNMRGMIVVGSVLFASVAAHAAPNTSPRPVPPPAPTPTLKAIPLAKVEATAAPAITRCGEPTKGKVTLANKTPSPWRGSVSFEAAGSTALPVALGAGETKTVDVEGPKLDCKKALVAQNIRVLKDGDANPVFSRTLQPTKVMGVRDLSGGAPPLTETKPWLRRVTLEAMCGGNVTGTVLITSFSTQDQEAKAKLGFGIYVQQPTVVVRPGNTPVGYGSPKPLDCSAPAGLPAFEYALLTGLASTGQLDTYDVTYEPK